MHVTITRDESGFSLIEVLVAMMLLLAVSSIATTALMQMTNSQMTIWNRTQMHSGIRGATELLQQEVGQAGRVNLPGTVTLDTMVTANLACDPGNPLLNAVNVGVSSTVAGNATAGMWATAGPPASYIVLTTLDGDQQETFRVGAVAASSISACFGKSHAMGTVIVPMGGFGTGVIPNSGMANGSSGSVLKLYGDVNGDGNMVYVEYTCDPMAPGAAPTSVPPGTGNLFRNVMPFDTTNKAMYVPQILLGNITTNPGLTPCFQYQPSAPVIIQGSPVTFILDVAITLTVQTEQIDPVTRAFQTETKALLNVSPRNVFNAWMLAGVSYTDRIQSTPTSVTLLLP